MAILPQILQPVVVNDRIKRIKVINDTFQRALGMQAGGSAVKKSPSRRGSYDIYNDTREVGGATMPGVEATTRARFPVGQVNFSVPRHAEKIPMPMEEINQYRPIGGPANVLDELGETYILAQEQNQHQLVTNLREFQVVAMLRGSYTWSKSGTAFNHSFSGGEVTIDFQIPAGNKSQLDMLGAGDIIGTAWDNAAAPIVRDIFQINQAFIELVGTGLTDIWVNSTVWGYIITNTEVQNLAGSAANPVASIVRNEETQDFTATLVALPWVTFHINDNVLTVNGTNTRLIPDTAAIFTVRMDSFVAEFMEVPEPVVDPVSMKMSQAYGEYFYYKILDDPVVYELHSRYNGLPMLKVPKGIAFATVDF